MKTPRAELGGVRAAPAVVLRDAGVDILCDARVVDGGIGEADENIDVVIECFRMGHAKP